MVKMKSEIQLSEIFFRVPFISSIFVCKFMMQAGIDSEVTEISA